MTAAEPLRASRSVPRSTSGTNLWTCPMHPQVQKAGPGSCPICGVALEPMTPAGGEAANPELRDMRRRFWVCVGLSVPLVALAMAEDFATPGPIASSAAVWVQIVLATPAAELFWILKHGIKMTGMPAITAMASCGPPWLLSRKFPV
jgi:Heavy metal binding domain